MTTRSTSKRISVPAGILALAATLAATLAASPGCSESPDEPPGGGEQTPGVLAEVTRYFGRVDTTDPLLPRFAWSGTGFVTRFSGRSLTMQLSVMGAPQIFKAVIDGAPQTPFTAGSGAGTYPVAAGLAAGVHTVEVYRQTEGAQGQTELTALLVGDGAFMSPPAGPGRLIEVIGDSITCGYGTLGTLADTDCFPTESHWDTYAAVAARTLGAEISTIAASGRGIIRNYGGETTGTMPMLYDRTMPNVPNRPWGFQVQPQAVVINLGTNDISNNKGDPGTAFRDTYVSLLATVRSKYPDAFILCIIGPLLSGVELTTIQGHVRSAVEARNTAGDAKVAFFDQIATQTSDKFACQYHPNVAQNQLMGDQLVGELRTRLGW